MKNEAVSIAVAANMVQNDSRFSSGNAMSRAPISSGMQKLPNAADQDRRHGEEDHDRAVHGEQRRVRRRRDRAARGREQQAADQRHRPARDGPSCHRISIARVPATRQEHQPQPQELAPDHLVIGGEDASGARTGWWRQWIP